MARKRALLRRAIPGQQDELRERIGRSIPGSTLLRLAVYAMDHGGAHWLIDLVRGRPLEVRLLIDELGCDPAAAHAFDELRNCSVKVHLASSPCGVLHAKAWLVENTKRYLGIVGSVNLSEAALATNHEASVLISGRPGDITYRRLAGWFDALWEDETCVEAWSTQLSNRICRRQRPRDTVAEGPLAILETWPAYVIGAVFGSGGVPEDGRGVYIEYRGQAEVTAPSGDRADQAGLLKRDIPRLAEMISDLQMATDLSTEVIQAGKSRWRVLLRSGDEPSMSELSEVVTNPDVRLQLLRSLSAATAHDIRLFLRGLADAKANVSEGTSADVLHYFGAGQNLDQVGRELVVLCRVFQHGLGVPIDWMEWPQQRKRQREFQLRVRASDFLSIGFSIAYRQQWLLEKAEKYPGRREQRCPRDPDDAFIPYCAEAGCPEAAEVLSNA